MLSPRPRAPEASARVQPCRPRAHLIASSTTKSRTQLQNCKDCPSATRHTATVCSAKGHFRCSFIEFFWPLAPVPTTWQPTLQKVVASALAGVPARGAPARPLVARRATRPVGAAKPLCRRTQMTILTRTVRLTRGQKLTAGGDGTRSGWVAEAVPSGLRRR